MSDSLVVKDSTKLKHTRIQRVVAKQSKDGSKGYLMDSIQVSECCYGQYREIAQKYDEKYRNYGVKELENEHWSKLNEQSNSWEAYLPRYAVDNNFSVLSPNSSIWNLNNFTGDDSDIHQVNIFKQLLRF